MAGFGQYGGGGGGGTQASTSAVQVDDPDLGVEDYEFGATTSDLPSGWSWFNQGSSTYSEANGVGIITVPAVTLETRGIVRSIPAGDTWTARFKVHAAIRSSAAADLQFFGVTLRNSATQDHYMFRLGSISGLLTTTATDDSFGGASNVATARVCLADGGVFRIIKSSSTSYAFAFSTNGNAFNTIATGVDVSAHTTPDQFGFLFYNDHSYTMSYELDWFRFE